MRTGNLETRGMPVDLDCEIFVLGGVLADFGRYWHQVADIVTAADFSVEKHRLIWAAAESLMRDGVAVDRVTVFKRLAERGEVDAVGGLSYLIDLDEGLPPMPNLSAYALRLREKSTLRNGVLAAQAIMEMLSAPGAGAAEVQEAERMIRRVAESQTKKRRLVSIGEVMRGSGSELADNRATAFLDASNTVGGIQTPWAWLNRSTGGFKGGNLVILAARPSVGKTSAAVQIVAHQITQGVGAVFVTLEMPKTDITRKIVATFAGVSMADWQNGELAQAERLAVQSAANAIKDANVFLDDEARATVPGIHAALLRHMAEHETRLVVIDYLQLLTPAGRSSNNRTDDVSEITRGLKLMAMELDVPVIALSQLSRSSAKEGRRPRLDDLRDSGSIEQDADIVMFLHRADKPIIELILAKQRLGPIGDCRLVFNPKTTTFREAGYEPDEN